jgi:flagella basal body P-ring formation protein FlgA
MRLLAALFALLTTATMCAPPAARAQMAGSQRISGKTFETLAKTALAHVTLSGDAELVQASSVPDQTLNAGSTSLDVQSPIVTPSFVNVPVRVDVDGAFVRTVFVGYRVQQYVHTAVAAHDLVPGTVIEPGDVKMARVATLARMANGTQALIGRKIFSAFRKGQPVFIEETETNQIVKPGSSVVLIVNDGGVSVVAEAVARTGGGLGDEVTVYNSSTNKTLSGLVVGPDRVQLDISGASQ